MQMASGSTALHRYLTCTNTFEWNIAPGRLSLTVDT